MQDRIGKAMEQLAVYQQQEGVFTKQYVLNHAKSMAPATLWATYGKHIPIIASIATRVLAQVVGKAEVKRTDIRRMSASHERGRNRRRRCIGRVARLLRSNGLSSES